MTSFFVLLSVVVLLCGGFVLIYNSLIKLKNRVQNSWAQIDVQLKRRFDLVPNLVETVKGYAGHEKDTLEKVTQARNSVQAAASVAQRQQAENLLTDTLRSLFALAEAYPQLQANQSFLDLQRELSELEAEIAFARQYYNDTTLQYNSQTQTFPSNLIAGLFGFQSMPYFQTEENQRQPVRVQF